MEVKYNDVFLYLSILLTIIGMTIPFVSVIFIRYDYKLICTLHSMTNKDESDKLSPFINTLIN